MKNIEGILNFEKYKRNFDNTPQRSFIKFLEKNRENICKTVENFFQKTSIVLTGGELQNCKILTRKSAKRGTQKGVN